jgi:hypothetical protein
MNRDTLLQFNRVTFMAGATIVGENTATMANAAANTGKG